MSVELEDLFKSFVWDKLVELVVQRIFFELPFLAWGPLGAITKIAIVFFSDKLYVHIKLCVDMNVISFMNREHQQAYDRAGVELKIIAMQKGIESPEFKEAREKAKHNLSKFVRF